MVTTAQRTKTTLLIKVFAVLVVLGTIGSVLGLFIFEHEPIDEPLSGSSGPPDFFSTTLIDRINETEAFLASHKLGSPYTAEPRPLTPVSEVVRLNIDAQVMGYLNLYKLTNNATYKNEADQRLQYIMGLGDQAYTNTGFMGQLGYSFLYAFQLTGDTAYREYGINIAHKCLALPNTERIMNWGYMCALNTGLAYQITGEQIFRDFGRVVSRQTSSRQFTNGAFSHQIKTYVNDARPYYGENTHYTSWITAEMMLYRRSDPGNPDVDTNLLRVTTFLKNRINADGSLNYADAYGSYYNDNPANGDTRGWMNELAYIGFNLKAAGKTTEAQKVLQFLFTKERTDGDNLGSYPDKWGWTDPSNVWTIGDPSVTRTSMIFWFLTSIPLIPTNCPNGEQTACAVSVTNCGYGLQELGACALGLQGQNTCIDGTYTKCTGDSIFTYNTASNCPTTPTLTRSCDVQGNQTFDETCSNSSVTGANLRKCVSGHCSSYCVGTSKDNPTCSTAVLTGDLCATDGASGPDDDSIPEIKKLPAR